MLHLTYTYNWLLLMVMKHIIANPSITSLPFDQHVSVRVVVVNVHVGGNSLTPSPTHWCMEPLRTEVTEPTTVIYDSSSL